MDLRGRRRMTLPGRNVAAKLLAVFGQFRAGAIIDVSACISEAYSMASDSNRGA
jgi:hypothetical protein